MRYEKSQAEGQVGSQMEMATNTAGQQTIESQSVEPYMKSGYEVLAERDYNAQVHYMAKDTYNPVGNKPAFDPCFSGREWWRDFVGEQPMEFQYGMLDHFREVEARKNEDEEML